MIYQLFHEIDQTKRLLFAPLYCGFGLSPECNSAILDNCPELADEKVRHQLSECGAMLYFWRNPDQVYHDWIGFTSWKQQEKTPLVLRDKKLIKNLTHKFDAVGLMKYNFGPKCPICLQAEQSHPGMVGFLLRACDAVGDPFPRNFMNAHEGFYSNYWLMSKENFMAYMEWLWRYIEFGLSRLDKDAYLKSLPRALAYALERLFIVWCLDQNKRVVDYNDYVFAP